MTTGAPADAVPKPADDFEARLQLDPLLLAAVNDVDETLLDWALSLSPLERLDACYGMIDTLIRLRDGGLRPDEYLLLKGRQPLLSTRVGPLDTPCILHDGRGFDELLPHTVVLDDNGYQLRVLDLETLIEVKSAANRDKDRVVVPILVKLRRKLKGED